jgi:serine protease
VDNIYSTLTSTARTPVVGLRGVFSPTYGYGIVDAAAAVAAPLG